MSEHRIENLRYQDAVARVAGVDLRTTVRVLRALAIVAQADHNEILDRELTKALLRSARQSRGAAPLHEKPDQQSIKSCDAVYKRISRRHNIDSLSRLHRLDNCPYHASNLYDELEGSE